ncbi:MAG TPA: nuclear transport factor 2 family protein [Candidatus Binataceae bacterium]|nr:nuclear transport factor 2 family protein [Candidatus Binataceae bacterium]
MSLSLGFVGGIYRDSMRRAKHHAQWMRANANFNIEDAVAVFVGGDGFHGFNLNRHTYGKRDEWVQLWTFLKNVMIIGDVRDEKDLRVNIRGDVAWVSFAADLVANALSSAGSAESGMALPTEPMSMHFRGSEVYVRKDDSGPKNWKMWRCHYSPHAPANEPRPAFGD